MKGGQEKRELIKPSAQDAMMCQEASQDPTASGEGSRNRGGITKHEPANRRRDAASLQLQGELAPLLAHTTLLRIEAEEASVRLSFPYSPLLLSPGANTHPQVFGRRFARPNHEAQVVPRPHTLAYGHRPQPRVNACQRQAKKA